MGRLRDWWNRVTGAAVAGAANARRAPPARSRPPPGSSSELSLEDSPPQSRARRAGRAGFDPYSSDGGFSKPHSWERLDHD